MGNPSNSLKVKVFYWNRTNDTFSNTQTRVLPQKEPHFGVKANRMPMPITEATEVFCAY